MGVIKNTIESGVVSVSISKADIARATNIKYQYNDKITEI